MTKSLLIPISPQFVARTRFSPSPHTAPQSLLPTEALAGLEDFIKTSCSTPDSVVLAGPGDPLATPDTTLETIQKIRTKFPEIEIAIRTMGIGSKKFAQALAESGVSSVEMCVEAVRPEIYEKLFAWIRPGSKTLKLQEAAQILIKEQASGVSALAFHSIQVTIKTTLYPGYNMDHVGKISSEMLELGAHDMILIPHSSESGAEVELESPSEEKIQTAKERASKHLKVKEYVEPLVLPDSTADNTNIQKIVNKPGGSRPNVAVVSSNGIDVDMHLGKAKRFLIYGPRTDGLPCLLETREAPAAGAGIHRWENVADVLKDCSLLLAGSVGNTPRKVLLDQGLGVFITNDNIDGLVDACYGGGKGKKKKSRQPKSN